jgi:hypothetical protein
MYNIPYGSLTADLTMDYNERTGLTGVQMVFSLLAMIVGAGATTLLAGMSTGYLRHGRFIRYLPCWEPDLLRISLLKGARQAFSQQDLRFWHSII